MMAGQTGNIVPAVLATVGVAAAIGLANGLIVSQLHVHGFIATLGVGLIVSGYLGTNYKGSAGSAPGAFRAIDETKIGPVPVSVLIMVAFAALAILLLQRTRIGHHMYAVGGSPEVARLSGLRTSPPVVVAHVLCSVMSALAGLLLLSRLSVGSPTIGSQGGYDLLSIAAVVLGGTLLAGGRGGILGTLGGVAIFAVMDSTMGALQVNPFLKDVVRGVIIIAAVAVYARRNLQVRPARFSAQEAR
jgi:ribose transport system permease protein